MIIPILTYFFLGLAKAIPESTLAQRHINLDASTKRGLLHITNANYHPGIKPEQDIPVWTRTGSDITWYYNYMLNPTIPNASYEFVPMVWGPDSIEKLSSSIETLKANGIKISHVLYFNEPDGDKNEGGSNVSPKEAAKLWSKYMEPIRTSHNISLGAPATKGNPDGIKWLSEFMNHCSNCHVGFIPFHWYGEATYLGSHILDIRAKFPDQQLWVTEYAPPPYMKKKEDSEEWFGNVTGLMDRSDDVERYSYWGAWRKRETPKAFKDSSMSMLSDQGKLTRIGGWYMHLAVESGGGSGLDRGSWGVWFGIVCSVLVM
jgi:hypothetical protein